MNIGTTGAFGEETALEWLVKHGYELVSRNFQTRFGEVDIICRDKRYIVFVEVKTRSAGYIGSGREAVTSSKQVKLIKAAMQYLQSRPTELQPRFDVIEVVLDGDKVSVEHIENAFGAGGGYGFF